MTFTQSQRAATLKAWIARRNKKGIIVTADELVARIKRNWPRSTEAEVDELYQVCG